ncbi:MAG: glycosyltransferase [Terracidiphilus sp.]
MCRWRTVLLVIPHLGGGGAERVTELLARHLSQERFEIHLGLVTQASIQSAAWPENVVVHALGARRVRDAALRLVVLIRRLRPVVVFSGIAHLNLLVLLLRPFFPRRTQILVRQNGPVSSTLSGPGSGGVLRRLHRVLYRSSDGIICQTKTMAEELSEFTGVPLKTLAVLPNPIDIDAIRSSLHDGADEWNGSGPHLLAIGRLSREKGFDLLLNALDKLKVRFRDADLAIAGAGREGTALGIQCGKLGLDRSVRLLGHVENPAIYFAGASLLVLSSRFEGMPNALLEAAAGGLPIVALPASGGLVELLHGRPGIWLAREISAEALAESLTAALQTIQPGERYAHPWVNQFRLEQAIPAYEELFDRTERMRPA